MRITERQLRRVIREVISESFNQESKESMNEGITGDAVRKAVLALVALNVTMPVAKSIVSNAMDSSDNSSRISIEQPFSSGPMNVNQKYDEVAEALSAELSKMSDEDIIKKYTEQQMRDMLTQIIHMRDHGSAGMGSLGQEAQPEVIEKLERILGNKPMMYTR
jgi:hypothetical protein